MTDNPDGEIESEVARHRRPSWLRFGRAMALIGIVLLPAATAVIAIETATHAIQSCTGNDSIGVHGRIGFVMALVLVPLVAYVTLAIVLVASKSWTRWRLGRVGIVTVLVCLAIGAAFLWLTMGQSPTSLCPTGIPAWWPSWLPVRVGNS